MNMTGYVTIALLAIWGVAYTYFMVKQNKK